MATEEARALLDALMGGDRNAPLPKGAAIPSKRSSSDKSALLLPGKRTKSCYDKDICPLYCAWGVDVYELFVNTKSDIGPNPYVVDEGARQEYLKLPSHEQARLGFDFPLFQKLHELVRSCDRTVQRNKEKLNQELQRQLQKRGGQDYVIDVDEMAVLQLAQAQVQADALKADIDKLLEELESKNETEKNLKQQLEPILKAKEAAAQQQQQKDAAEQEEGGQDEADAEAEQNVKAEVDSTTDPTQPNGKEPSGPVKTEPDANAPDKTQENGGPPPPQEPAEDVTKQQDKPNVEETNNDQPVAVDEEEMKKLQTELGLLLLAKQRVLFELGARLSQLGPLLESIEKQQSNLNHVKSDITSDKTVCEVSGNFMSARDADERIAAHYAGKQYVGWKLVRDKYKEMVEKYGRHGPPRPAPPDGSRGPPSRSGGYPSHHAGGRGGRYDGGGGYRGGDRRRRRSPSPPHWERGGGYDRRRSGGAGGYREGGGGGGGGGGYRRR